MVPESFGDGLVLTKLKYLSACQLLPFISVHEGPVCLQCEMTRETSSVCLPAAGSHVNIPEFP